MQNVDIGCCIPWCCFLGRLWGVRGPALDSSQACAAEETRTVSERLYFTCWHFCDPEKNLGAALAAGLFLQQLTAFVLVATWYVVAFWSHTKMLRNFAKRSALDCVVRERPEETARVRNDGQMTTRRAVKSSYHSSVLDSQTKGKFILT